MPKTSVCLAATVALLIGTAGAALAQSAAPAGDPSSNLAVTGKHMRDPGRSRSDGVTSLDRKEERQMRKETAICKGC